MEVVLASAASEDGLDVRLREQLFEIDVPDPRDIATVHVSIVDEECHCARPLIGTYDAQILIEASGVLRQVQQHTAPIHGVFLQAPILRIESVHSCLYHLRWAICLHCGDEYSQQVIDHIAAGELGGELRCMPGFSIEDIEGEAMRVQAHIHSSEGQRRSRESAGRALVCTQLPILTIPIGQHRAAALAHGGVCHQILLQVHTAVHAEGDRCRRRCPSRFSSSASRNGFAKRVVRVVYERRVRRPGQTSHDSILDAVYLTAAVQLITEEVQQYQIARTQVWEHFR